MTLTGESSSLVSRSKFSGFRSLDVIREIPMHYFILVAIVDGGEELVDDGHGVLLAEEGLLDNLLEEFTALAQFRHNVVSLFILEEFVKLQDIRVILG